MHQNNYTEEELAYNKFTEEAVKEALKEVRDKSCKNPRILDIGCGPGAHLKIINSLFKEPEITAIDISKPHIKHAKKISEQTDLDIEFKILDINKPLNVDQEFDIIWCADVLHLEDIDTSTVLDNCEKTLSDEGILAVFHGEWLNQSILNRDSSLESKLQAERARKFQENGKENFSTTVEKIDQRFDNVDTSFYKITKTKDIDEKTIQHFKNVLSTYFSINTSDLTKKEEERLKEIKQEGIEEYIQESKNYFATIKPKVHISRRKP